MLDFRSCAHARPFSSRSARLRVAAWVLGIGLVVLVGLRFREISEFVSARSAAASHSVDTRYRPAARDSDAANTVRILKPETPQISHNDAPKLPGLDATLLAQVRDDTPWIRNDEIDAWWNVWSMLDRTDDKELAGASGGKVGFVELFSQPKAFRGKVVTIRGSARQVTYMTAGENSHGIKGYYRLVIWPENGPAEPIFVYALELPESFPTGEHTRADIEAAGVFFKRMVYPTEHEELRRAPVIMARTVSWQATQASTSKQSAAHFSLLIALTVAGAGLFALVLWWASRGGAAVPHRFASAPKLDDAKVVDVKAALRQLAESEP